MLVCGVHACAGLLACRKLRCAWFHMQARGCKRTPLWLLSFVAPLLRPGPAWVDPSPPRASFQHTAPRPAPPSLRRPSSHPARCCAGTSPAGWRGGEVGGWAAPAPPNGIPPTPPMPPTRLQYAAPLLMPRPLSFPSLPSFRAPGQVHYVDPPKGSQMEVMASPHHPVTPPFPSSFLSRPQARCIT